MSKKYIRVENTKVVFTHFMPFDAVNGMGRTEQELLNDGYLLDEIPEPDKSKMTNGEIPEGHYTKEKGFYYEYVAPLMDKQNMTLVESVKSGIISKEQFEKITGIPYIG